MTSYAVLMDVHGAYVSQITLHTHFKHLEAAFGAGVVACCMDIISWKINLTNAPKHVETKDLYTGVVPPTMYGVI